MASQKSVSADPTSADQITFLFRLANALVLDGWGASVAANPQGAALTTNAPQRILDQHAGNLVSQMA